MARRPFSRQTVNQRQTLTGTVQPIPGNQSASSSERRSLLTQPASVSLYLLSPHTAVKAIQTKGTRDGASNLHHFRPTTTYSKIDPESQPGWLAWVGTFEMDQRPGIKCGVVGNSNASPLPDYRKPVTFPSTCLIESWTASCRTAFACPSLVYMFGKTYFQETSPCR
jgi:hypothetical protein